MAYQVVGKCNFGTMIDQILDRAFRNYTDAKLSTKNEIRKCIPEFNNTKLDEVEEGSVEVQEGSLGGGGDGGGVGAAEEREAEKVGGGGGVAGGRGSSGPCGGEKP